MIQRNVEEGRWPVGHRIPSERELCQQHGVSRTTVRIAIAEAVNRGLLHRVHGKGTFVARPKIHQPLVQVTPFAAALRAQGLVPRTRLLEVMTQPADPATAHMLGMPTGHEVMRFRLLGLGSGEPMAAYQSTVPASLGEAVLEQLEADVDADRFRLVVDVLAETFGWSHLTAGSRPLKPPGPRPKRPACSPSPGHAGAGRLVAGPQPGRPGGGVRPGGLPRRPVPLPPDAPDRDEPGRAPHVRFPP